MKKFSFILSVAFLLLHFQAVANNVRGVLVDDGGEPLIASTVLLVDANDSTQLYHAATKIDGSFEFRDLKLKDYKITFSYLGYKQEQQEFTLRRRGKDFGKVRLHQEAVELDAVQVSGKAVRASQRGDTTEFNADSYKVTRDAAAEDLLKKLPGITVENGTIKTQGEDVKKILVDGKQFFGDDPSIAIRNLPAEVINKIEVYDRLSDQSQLTGFDDGEGVKTINIVTKKDRRIGQFGRVYGGVGYDDTQDEGRYSAGGNLNLFNSKRRVSIIGMTNNVNQQNFAMEDMTSVSGSGRRNRNMFAGNSSGIATSHALGVNYSDLWNDKTEVTGSYFFNYSDKETTTELTRNYLQQTDTTQRYDEASNSNNETYNHRFNLRLDHKFNENTSLLYSPSLSFQTTQSTSLSSSAMQFNEQPLNSSDNSNKNNSHNLNLNNELLLRHKFQKQGRSFSIRLVGNIGDANSESTLLNSSEFANNANVETRNQQSGNPVNNWSARSNVAYTEPIGEKSMLQVNYDINYAFGESNKQTYNYDPNLQSFNTLDSLYSNIYNNDYITQQAGLTYRYHNEKANASVGVNYQLAQLNGEQTVPQPATTKHNFTSLLPIARYEYKFSKQQSFRVFYRASTNAPSVSQLQEVIDNSNPLLLRTGNPNLSQTDNHTLSLRYNQTTLEKGTTLFAMLFANAINNYITTGTITAQRDTVLNSNTNDTIWLRKGSQFSQSVNVDGYWNARAALNFGIPVGIIKSNLNIMTMGTYTRQPGFVNGKKNISDNYSLTGGLTLASNISEFLDFNISYNPSYNTASNSLQMQQNNSYFKHSLNGRLNWITWKSITFQFIAQYEQYKGLDEGYNEEYLRMDAGIGKKFLKNNQAEIKLMVYDIFNQAKNYNRSVTENYIEDSLSKVLSRYFMLTLTYTLRKFGNPPAQRNAEEGQPRQPPAFR